MISLHIKDEIAPLEQVVLGTAQSNGPTPKLEEAYDPKSKAHILAGTYPKEKDMILEMDAVASVFSKYGVKVYRPEVIQNYNQIFSRDIGFVIDNTFVKANILPDRAKELQAINDVLSQIAPEQIIEFPDTAHIEGGDVMPWHNYVFVGTYYGSDYTDYITARTNKEAVTRLQNAFPHKEVKSFNLKKSNTNPKENALHLDCCFQPLGQGKAIIHKEGFLDQAEYQWLISLFGASNCFHITKEEMYAMYSNVFSIAPDVVISERNFDRLNQWLHDNRFVVEEVPYAEIAKQEGLLRCSTLPLVRQK